MFDSTGAHDRRGCSFVAISPLPAACPLPPAPLPSSLSLTLSHLLSSLTPLPALLPLLVSPCPSPPSPPPHLSLPLSPSPAGDQAAPARRPLQRRHLAAAAVAAAHPTGPGRGRTAGHGEHSGDWGEGTTGHRGGTPRGGHYGTWGAPGRHRSAG